MLGYQLLSCQPVDLKSDSVALKTLYMQLKKVVQFPAMELKALPLLLPQDEPGSFILDEHGLQGLRRLGDAVLFRTVIFGPMRNGKSSLQNWLVQLMGLHRNLFGTSSGVGSCTRGVHAFALPLKFLWPEAPANAFLLLFDCEGSGDAQHEGADGLYDTKLFMNAMLLSDVFCFNTKQVLDSSVVDRVATWRQPVDEIFSAIQERQVTPPCPDLLFIIRDHTLDAGAKSVGFYRHLVQNGGLAQQVLQACFNSIDIVMFPPPFNKGSEASQLSQMQRRDLAPGFRKELSGLKEHIMNCAVAAFKEGRTLAALQFVDKLQEMVAVVNASNPEPVALLSLARAAAVGAHVRKVVDYWQGLRENLQEQLPLTDEKLESEIQRMLDTAMSQLRGSDVFCQCGEQERAKMQNDFLSNIDSWQRVLRNENMEQTYCQLMTKESEINESLPDLDAEPTILQKWLEGAVQTLRMQVGSKATIDNFVQLFQEIHAEQVENAIARQQQRLEREQHLKDLKKQQEENEAQIKKALEDAQEQSNASKAEAKKELDDFLQKCKKDLQDVHDAHQKTVNDLKTNHSEDLKKQLQTQKQQLENYHKTQADNLNSQIKALKDQAKDLQDKNDDLATQIKDHKCSNNTCFSGDCTIETLDGRVQMCQLKVGDLVRSMSGWQPIIGFYDYVPDGAREFMELKWAGGSVTLTENHLLLVDGLLQQAQRVKPGVTLSLIQGSSRDNIETCTVLEITTCRKTGVFSPATLSGWIEVGGVLCSAYAKPTRFAAVPISDAMVHRLCHNLSTPLRWWFRASLALGCSSPPTDSPYAVELLKKFACPLVHLITVLSSVGFDKGLPTSIQHVQKLEETEEAHWSASRREWSSPSLDQQCPF